MVYLNCSPWILTFNCMHSIKISNSLSNQSTSAAHFLRMGNFFRNEICKIFPTRQKKEFSFKLKLTALQKEYKNSHIKVWINSKSILSPLPRRLAPMQSFNTTRKLVVWVLRVCGCECVTKGVMCALLWKEKLKEIQKLV